MGDYLLMKNSILILSFLVTSTLFSSELSWVDEQVQAIKPPREGMLKSSLRSIESPFIFLAKNRGKDKKALKSKKPSTSTKLTNATFIKKKTRSTLFSLNLIMNNNAMINGRWYKTGNKISGYTIIKIDKRSVLLSKANRRILLSTKSKSTQLHFKNK
jgi:hypothetical protein